MADTSRRMALAAWTLLAAACGTSAPSASPDTGADIHSDAAAADLTAEDGVDSAGADAATGDSSSSDAEILGRDKPCKTPADCGDPAGPCLGHYCHSQLGCVATALPDDALCDDNDPCTATSSCQLGSCKGLEGKDCDDGDPCTDDGCAGGTCTSLPTAASPTACDDGSACTLGDACKGGVCAPGTSICLCASDADCKDKQLGKDGKADLCAGTWYCAVQVGGGKACVQNPATVVACDKSADSPCQVNACAPSTGTCSMVQTPNKAPCDDGKPCTEGDVCKGGACQPGTQVCCQADVDCKGLEDGDACNGTLFCNEAVGKCQLNPATVVSCATVDDTSCKKTVCEPKSGTCVAKFAPDGESCDDGSPCTASESCQTGSCVPSGNTCPCKVDADCKGKDDQDFCNGVPYCDLKSSTCKTNPATVVICPTVDDTTCKKNTCDGKSGACAPKAVFDSTPCNADGNPCTPNDSCQEGTCKVGAPNTCKCSTLADCAAYEDGDACNGMLYCDKSGAVGDGLGVCSLNPASIPSCPSVDNTACSKSICQPKTGKCAMTFVQQNKVCDDGDPCTKGDICENGACKSGGGICLCKQNQDCLPQEDGDACNGTLFCDKSALPWSCSVSPSTVITCPSVNDSYCQKSTCQPLTGLCKLLPLHTDEPCDDSDTCTVNTVCKGGLCADPLAGSGGKCNDGNPCTDDSCDKSLGCQYAANVAACDDDDLCTSLEVCKDKVCQKGKPKSCDDANVCTTDLCNPQLGCIVFTNTDPCSDGNSCTINDACGAGKCLAGLAKDCKDSNLCSLDSCDSKTGVCSNNDKLPPSQVCDDGVACTVETCLPQTGCVNMAADSACDDNVACTKDVCNKLSGCSHLSQHDACEDGSPCTTDSCVAGVGCQSLPAADGGACADDDPCTTGDACKAGKCVSGPKSPSCNVDPAQCAGKADGSACDDGNACSKGETCGGGVCRALAPHVEVETLIDHEADQIVDGPRLLARTRRPFGLALAPSGAMALLSEGVQGVRELGADGVVRTVAGSHVASPTPLPVDGKAGAATFDSPRGIIYAADGSAAIADTGHDAIRWMAKNRDVTTLAGGQGAGYADGKGAAAKFNDPIDVALGKDDAVWVADDINCLIRRVTLTGDVTTVAGAPGACAVVDGKGGAARFHRPYGMARAPDGSFVIADRYGAAIRRLQPDGTVTTLAGGAGGDALDGKGAAAKFSEPCDVAVANDGTVYSVECGSHRLRRITSDGVVVSLLANAAGLANGKASVAQLHIPARIAIDAYGDLIVGDYGNQRVRKVRLRHDTCDDGNNCTRDECDPKTGKCVHPKISCDDGRPCTTDACDAATGACSHVPFILGAPCDDGDPCTAFNFCGGSQCYASATTAGIGSGSGHQDGPLASARFSGAWGMRRAPDGRIAVVEMAGRIRMISADGNVRTVAGGLVGGGLQDGQAFEARFNSPCGIDFQPDGGLVVADTYNHRLRQISPKGNVTTLVGGDIGFQDGAAAVATFYFPTDVRVASGGAVLIADRLNNRIRRLEGGVVTTAAGNGVPQLRDGPAAVASFDQPMCLDFGPDGSLYISDHYNNAIRRLTPDGFVVTVIGSRRPVDAEGVGRAASLHQPVGIDVLDDGTIWVATSPGKVARIDASRRLALVAGGGSAAQGPGPLVAMSQLLGIVGLPDGGALVSWHQSSPLWKIAAPAPLCDDGNACTADGCIPGKGCVALQLALECADGDPCTVGDACASGVCKPGPKAVDCKCKAVADFGCNDGDPCTDSLCDAKNGCSHKPRPTGSPCDDGSACTSGERCRGGACKPNRDDMVAVPAGGPETAANLVGPHDGSTMQVDGQTIARWQGVVAMAAEPDGSVLVVDATNHSARRWKAAGSGATLAGGLGQNLGHVNGAPTEARFHQPEGIDRGKQGEILVASRNDHTIRRIATDGTVSTLAGTQGAVGHVDGKGAVARFNHPMGLSFDSAGAAILVDHANHAIRKISADGTVTSLAGSTGGLIGFVDGPGSVARFNYPNDVVVAPSGVAWVADGGNAALRSISPQGIVTTALVHGHTSAPLSGIGQRSVAIPAIFGVDYADDSVLFLDFSLHVVRRYDPATETVTLVAGGGNASAGLGAAVALTQVRAIAARPDGSILASMASTSRLRLLRPRGASCDDGDACTLDACDPAKGCQHVVGKPADLCPDAGPCQEPTCDVAEGICRYKARLDGTLCGEKGQCAQVCSRGACTHAGLMQAVAGTGGAGYKDGPAAIAQFHSPSDIVGDGKGNLYVSEMGNPRVRKIDASGAVTTLAGQVSAGYAEGKGEKAKFQALSAIDYDGVGFLYVVDGVNQRVRKVDLEGNVVTALGSGVIGSKDGDALAASLNFPVGVAAGPGGVVYVSDAGNHVLRLLEGGKVTTIAGVVGQCAGVDGPLGSNRLCSPAGLDLAADGRLWIADSGSFSIRRLDTKGALTTVSGDPGYPMRADFDGVGPRASGFYQPTDIVALADGTALVTSQAGATVRRVWPFERVETPVGKIDAPLAALPGLGPTARLRGHSGVGGDGVGGIWLADRNNHMVRRLRFDLQACGDLLGASAASPAVSCKAYQAVSKVTTLLDVWLDPDGPGGQPPFATRCDLQTAGGGWNLIHPDIHKDQLQKLLGDKPQMLLKCNQAAETGIISPPFTPPWSWAQKQAVAGTWSVAGVDVACGSTPEFSALACGWGIGCVQVGGPGGLFPGQTAVDQCGPPSAAWTTGPFAICGGKTAHTDWHVYVR